MVLCSLGFWQLQRAAEKKHLVEQQKHFAAQTPRQWTGHEAVQQFQTLQLSGHYLPSLFLLDNQFYQHQFGYDILSPLRLSNGRIVLVDRGWVLGDVSRRNFPTPVVPSGLINLSGTVYYPSPKIWVMGLESEKKADNVLLLEKINTQLVSEILHKSVYPFIIRLSPEESSGFIRDWPVVSLSPDRHLGYAFQWFAMALAVLIIFISLTLKKKE